MVKMIIYAIDDEPFMLEALLEAIKEALPQAEVMGFLRANKFLEAFKKVPCDIAFMDIELPVTDGVVLAEQLMAIKKELNIIFVTAYAGYKASAMDVYASDYLMKPVSVADIKEGMKHLRYPLKGNEHRYRAFTFGNFSLYVDGKPVTFHRRRSAEILAYLVARAGTVVSRVELTLILFEDERHTPQSRKNLENAIYTLQADLQAVQAEAILYRGSDGLAVNREILDADFFDYLQGKDLRYPGQFMDQYSWSEFFKSNFE